jgi:putative aldouronate transport system permease protein
MVDGAGRFRKLVHITLPGIAPTIIILLILRLGAMMSVMGAGGFERVLLLYNPMTFETADVVQTYVFRKGILEMDFAFSAAVGLFNSVINFTLLLTANAISRRVNETSLW